MGLINSTDQQYYVGDDFGNYQFVSLEAIINQFMIAYVGEQKIISKVKRSDVAFHAQRALAELSFDTFKSFKSQEISVPASLQMILPQDYVNYTKISWVDSSGIKHPIYPTTKTSNPTSISQDSNGEYLSIISGFKEGLTTDETNITYASTIAHDTANSQADFTAAAQFDKLNWNNVNNFEVGKYYTLTYTISNVPYLDPISTAVVAQVQPIIIDNFDNYIDFTAQSKNGTYTQTVVLGVNDLGSNHENRFYFQVSNATAFTGSISNVKLVENVNLSVDNGGLNSESSTWSSYKSQTPSENNNDNYEDDTYWPLEGTRYGLDPQHAQTNGSFYIDQNSGKIHFSSNISGKTVILDYVSDNLGSDNEMRVHKFAEEAMYKWIAHAVLSTRVNIPEQLVMRFKKERFAEVRKAKLRLSNIKLEELTQILRGKSKQIKH
tara:strand:+ start:953 stop:2260 length:1308 start_codon:yes stop_codon:yes gene_type:complete